jgi:hypothetical protein
VTALQHGQFSAHRLYRKNPRAFTAFDVWLN